MPKILDSCIDKVEKQGDVESAWGVCINQLRKSGLIKQKKEEGKKTRGWELTSKGKKRSSDLYGDVTRPPIQELVDEINEHLDLIPPVYSPFGEDEEIVDERLDRLPGGKGDELEDEEVDRDELEMGIKTELEHTDDELVAQEIALDHLEEDPMYYTKLRNAGLADELEKDVQQEKDAADPLSEGFWSLAVLENDRSGLPRRKIRFENGRFRMDYLQETYGQPWEDAVKNCPNVLNWPASSKIKNPSKFDFNQTDDSCPPLPKECCDDCAYEREEKGGVPSVKCVKTKMSSAMKARMSAN